MEGDWEGGGYSVGSVRAPSGKFLRLWSRCRHRTWAHLGGTSVSSVGRRKRKRERFWAAAAALPPEPLAALFDGGGGGGGCAGACGGGCCGGSCGGLWRAAAACCCCLLLLLLDAPAAACCLLLAACCLLLAAACCCLVLLDTEAGKKRLRIRPGCTSLGSRHLAAWCWCVCGGCVGGVCGGGWQVGEGSVCGRKICFLAVLTLTSYCIRTFLNSPLEVIVRRPS